MQGVVANLYVELLTPIVTVFGDSIWEEVIIVSSVRSLGWALI